jgi:hypothetical protein
MPDEPAPAPVAPVRVSGIVRGRELAFEGVLTLGETGLRLAPASADPSDLSPAGGVVLRYATIEGARAEAGLVALYLPGGEDVVELSAGAGQAAALGAALAELTRRACALPELTHHLRALGSERARPGSDHDRFYGPLLAARRSAQVIASPADQLRAFDAALLRDGAEQALADFAAARFPDAAPDRRALHAELDEIAEPLWRSLAALERAHDAAQSSPDDTLFVRWRAWAAAVRAVFVAADRVWLAALPALADSRGREGRLWRRVLWRR